MSPFCTGIFTSPATSPLESVVIVCAQTGSTESAKPAARLTTTNSRRENLLGDRGTSKWRTSNGRSSRLLLSWLMAPPVGAMLVVNVSPSTHLDKRVFDKGGEGFS